jgi:hypothetical protein
MRVFTSSGLVIPETLIQTHHVIPFAAILVRHKVSQVLRIGDYGQHVHFSWKDTLSLQPISQPLYGEAGSTRGWALICVPAIFYCWRLASCSKGNLSNAFHGAITHCKKQTGFIPFPSKHRPLAPQRPRPPVSGSDQTSLPNIRTMSPFGLPLVYLRTPKASRR